MCLLGIWIPQSQTKLNAWHSPHLPMSSFINAISKILLIFLKHWRLVIGLAHSGQVMHICVGNLTIIGSDNARSAPSHYLNQCWNIANWPLGTNFSEILIEINKFSFKQMHLMSSGKWRPFYLGLNVLILVQWMTISDSWAPTHWFARRVTWTYMMQLIREQQTSLTHWGPDKITAISQTTF